MAGHAHLEVHSHFTLLGATAADDPFLTMEIDLERAEIAKRSYPRYVPD